MMIHDDEIKLYRALKEKYRAGGDSRFATDIAVEIGINEKRAVYILEKWSGRGLWNSGVTTRSGWFEEVNPRYAAWFNELIGNTE